MEFDENGWEIPDPTPVALPIGAKRPESLQQQIARMVRSQFLLRRQADGFESPEEADDLDPDDDDSSGFPPSPWELSADQDGSALSLLQAEGRGQVVDAAATGGAAKAAPDQKVEAAPASGAA